MRLMRAFFLALLIAFGFALPAQAQDHFPAPSNLANDAANFPVGIVLGNPKGDVTLVEFFDYNCPYCRKSAQDMGTLLKEDRNVRVLLINYAVLGIPSIEAARVALAFAKQKYADYPKFHQKVFEGRGKIDGERAIAAAVALGANRKKLEDDANADAVTDMLKRAATLGDHIGLMATPSFIILTEAYVGDPGLPELRKIIASVRKCEKVAC
jgi:protein-disulfide isomerase